MKKKNYLIICISVLVCIVLGIVIAVYISGSKNPNYGKQQELYNGLPVLDTQTMLMYDTSTPEKAIGASDYVFVAKVNQILRTEYKNYVTKEVGLFRKETVGTPYTIYSIDVVKNIKGELVTTEPIEFMQCGGINEDGKSYTFINGSRLLEDGKYYIIMAETWGGNGGMIEMAEKDRIIELGENYNTKSANNINLIEKYEEAYKNQVVPTDSEGNQRTGYKSKYDVNY